MTQIGGGLEQGPWQTPTHLDYADDNIIYTGHSTLIYRSTNQGTSWTPVYAPPAFGGGRSIDQCYNQPDFVVCCGASRIFYSTDRGLTWQPTAVTPGTASAITDIAVHPDDPNIMAVTVGTYSSTFRQIQKTTDGGNSWHPIDGTLPDVACQSIAIDFDNPDTWFLGTDLTVYVSFDQGETWSPLNNGLPNVVCDDVRWHPDGYLRVATHGRGLWELDISALTPASTPEPGPARIEPLTLRILNNPASDRVRIRYGLRQAGNARLGLYDATGRQVRSLLDEHLEANSDGFEVDVRNLASGVYFAKLEANGAEISRKLVVQH
ncbi:MAG: T9SS type A sorting domain-containing protein [Candidatus Eisenbacteria bacterium]